jgi:hypothetical protein
MFEEANFLFVAAEGISKNIVLKPLAVLSHDHNCRFYFQEFTGARLPAINQLHQHGINKRMEPVVTLHYALMLRRDNTMKDNSQKIIK